MSKRKLTITLGAVAAVVILWAVFRPELLFINKTVDESLPSAATDGKSKAQTVLATGNFYSVAHETMGTATVHRLADGRRVLRFTNFETSNGPDVRVFLAAAPMPKDNESVSDGGYLSLGSLKGTKGDQNYDIPGDLDLSQYRSVVVWCNRFGVNFGAASLQRQGTEPVTLSQGQFHSVAHETMGQATIYRLADGRRILRLSDFETSNGPDVRVFLAVAADASDNETVKNGGYVSLGSLKGTKGDQNYDIPADLDLSQYRSVVIWCNRFGVNFATAPLSDKMMTSKL